MDDIKATRITKLTNQAVSIYYILMIITALILGTVSFFDLRMDWIIWYVTVFVLLHIAWIILIIKTKYRFNQYFLPNYYIFMVTYVFPVALMFWQIQVFSIILLYILLPLIILFHFNLLKYTLYACICSVLCIVAIIVASTKYELLQIDVSKQVISTLNTIIVIAAVAFIFVFFYFYLEIIKPMDDKKNFASAPEEKIQEAESVQLKELYNNIVNYFEKKQPYCHPNYRLTLLATDLNTNTKYVSNAINKYYGGTFDNFLNKYRIEYVKKMLDEHLDEKYTMEYIYTLAGYSNRTTFYVNFQKIMKMSPRDYHELKNSKVLVSK